jgi:uncharacterized protein
MPANLSPDYLEAERAYKSAQTAAEKIEALERMCSTLPKHKGTEKLYADLKRRLSQARKEGQKKGASHATPFYWVKKEGAGQVVLLGPPNSGKSSLVKALTHAHPEVAEYPFTTRAPLPGMMRYENVQIQLLDMPPIAQEFTEPWVAQVIRNAEESVLVVDAADDDALGEIDFILAMVEDRKLKPPCFLLANKMDVPGASENYGALRELYGERFAYLAVSAETGKGLDAFRRAVFDALSLVRVYTKAPGKKTDTSSPFVLHRGQTVMDAARMVHKDFAEHLRYARLFRLDRDHDGMMVERTHVLEDEDILEFHAG